MHKFKVYKLQGGFEDVEAHEYAQEGEFFVFYGEFDSDSLKRQKVLTIAARNVKKIVQAD